ncbi:MAG: PAS domain-containing protein [Verrucomicrobiales bacterium]|nr:PAS domain-containing protein [Verrucomicrobiales bacterium]
MQGPAWRWSRVMLLFPFIWGTIADRAQSELHPWTPATVTDQGWQIASLRDDGQLRGLNLFNLDFVADPRNRDFGTVWLASSSGLHRYDGFHWQRFGTNQGLPSDFVRCVTVTPSGHVWVGTDRGAGQFDGHQFRTLGSESGLAGPNVRRITVDPDGSLWFASDSWPNVERSGGLARYRDGMWRTYHETDGLESGYVVNQILASDGRRFAATLKGVFQLQDDRWQPSDSSDAFHGQKLSSACFAESPRWGLCFSTGRRLYVYQNDRWSPLPGPDSHHSHGILVTADGALVAAVDVAHGRKAFHEWTTNGWRQASADFAAPHLYSEDLREAPDGALWAVGFDCLVRWQRRDSKWREYSDLPQPTLVDASGATWFAGDPLHHRPTNPVTRLPDGTWRRWEVPSSGLVADATGSVWSWHGSGLNRWNGAEGARFDEASTGIRSIAHVEPDRDNTLWVVGRNAASNHVVAAFADQRWISIPWPWTDPSLQVLSTHAANQGVWIILVPPDQSEYLAAHVTHQGIQTVEIPPSKTSRFGFNLLASQKDPSLWIFGDGGLFRAEGVPPTQWTTITNLPGRVVFSVIERQHEFWFGYNSSTGGSASGLARWRDGVWSTFPVDILSNLSQAADGTLVAGGNGGFSIVPPEPGAQPCRVDLPTSHLVDRVLKDANGSYWISSGSRVLEFRPDGIAPDTRLITHDSEVIRGHRIRIDATAIGRFQSSDRLRDACFSWQLDDQPWTDFLPERSWRIDTEPLRTGLHTVRARARDSGLDIDATPVVATFTVQPVPLQSLAWFGPTIGGAAIAFALLAAAALTARSRLAQHARVLERRVEERTAQLKSDLVMRQRAEEELHRVNRALRALIECNQALVRATDESQLLQAICETVVHLGGYVSAWIGYPQNDPDRRITVAAAAGEALDAVNSLVITWSDTPSGRGPTGTAQRTGTACAVQDLKSDPSIAPWRRLSNRYGHASACSVPLRANGSVLGTLTVYSNIRGHFAPEEIQLLQELADDLAFGILALRTRAAHSAAEAALKNSEERFRQLAESIREVFWLTDVAKQRMIYVSPGYETVWGRSCADLYDSPRAWLEAIHTDDRDHVQKALARQSTGAYDEEYRIVRPDRGVRWIHDRAFPIRDGDGQVYRIAGIAEDITERRRAQEDLRRFVSFSPAVLYAIKVEADGARCVWVSDNIERLTGFPAAEAMAPGWWEAQIDPKDLPRVLEAHKDNAHLDHQTLEFRFRHRTGRDIFIHDQWCVVRNSAGAPEEIIGTWTDVTDRVALEQQLRQAQKMEAIGRLSGGIAHDFNNILGAVIGNVELARYDLPTQHPVVECLDEIGAAAQRAKKLVQQILAFARQSPPERVVIDLTRLVGESLDMLRAMLPAGVELNLRTDHRPIHIRGDSVQIHQLILNLGTNAWHALDGKPGRISVSLDRAEIDTALARRLGNLKPGTHAALAITDSGVGMSETLLTRIFEPFFTTKPPGHGTGLGLSVAHGIVLAHDGAIEVTSKEGAGSTFRIYLPVTSDVPSDIDLPKTVAAPGAGQHILFVDDEEAMVHVATRLLARAGFRISAFENPGDALNAFRADPAAYDAVVTDFNMPRLSGLDLAQSLRRIRGDTPIILVSGYLADDTRQWAEDTHLSAIIHKPEFADALIPTLHRVFLNPIADSAG